MMKDEGGIDSSLRISPSPVSPSPRPVVPVSAVSRFRITVSAALGTTLVLLGIVAALVSVLARRSNEFGLATIASILSLVLAGLIIILVVPPLARSARFEVARLDLP